MSKLPKIFLNLDFYSKGRNLRWIQENGIESVAILQNVWIASSQERGCKIKKEDAYALPFFLLFKKELVIKVLDSAVEVGLLESDGENYFNSQILTDSNKFLEKHNNYVKSHKKRKKNQSKSTMDSSQNQDESSMDSIDIDTDIDTDQDHKNKKKSKPQKIQFGEYVFLTDSEIQKFKGDLGDQAFERCCEKLNAWIGSKPNIDRRTNGKNAAATFRSWVINAIAKEQASASSLAPNKPKTENGYGANHLKNLELIAKYEAEEAAQNAK